MSVPGTSETYSFEPGRSTHCRIADARHRMSVQRRIPDAAQRGREGRHMTPSRPFSLDCEILPSGRSRHSALNVWLSLLSRHGAEGSRRSAHDPNAKFIRYQSTILDDYSRYIVAWKLCTTTKAGDVTDTLELALKASGCDQATVVLGPHDGLTRRIFIHLFL